jgi:peptide/nickel transport system permease protein
MGRYIARRLIQSFFVIMGVVILVFILARLAGDPAVLYLPLLAPEELREAFREEHGLNQPIMVQLGQFLWDVARLDFGESMWQHRPAMPVVLSRLPLTLKLAAATVAIGMSIAFVLGILAALRPLSIFDRVVSAVSLVGMTVPSFWLGLVLIMIFAVRLDLVPTSGTGGVKYLILPVITLTWPMLGRMSQVVRSSVLEQLSSPYIVTARAKGLRERVVLLRHVARNALIPVITVAGLAFIGIANGAVIVETVFGWPGIGKLMIDAIERRDFAVIQAVVFVVAVVVVVLNLFLDLCYAAIDPRIRYE